MTFDTVTAYQALFPYVHTRVKQHEPLARHSAFGVGGPADIWVSVETSDELIKLVNLCAEQHWPLLIMGNGSNTIFSDVGVRGIVAHIALTSYHLEVESGDKMLLVADAGVNWPTLVYACARQGWGGLEFGVGIPGTLGGAVVSNAGAHNREIGEAIAWIEVLDARGANNGEEGYSYPLTQHYRHDELDLSYRYSRFRLLRQTHFDEQGSLVAPSRQMIDPAEIILRMGLKLHRESPELLQERLAQYKQNRASTEPVQPHRGLIFKDPSGEQARSLIEQVSMQGMSCGRAQIAEDNANYIINLGDAKAEDIIWLIEETHRRVLAQLDIDLQLDIEYMAVDWQA
jgi:UDP-N-acetylmuramate dehydrogenase